MNTFPNDFDFNLYRLFYNDLIHLSDIELKNHYLNFGYNEGRIYKLPCDFNTKTYKELNEDLQHLNDNDLMIHYANFGKFENRKYKSNNLRVKAVQTEKIIPKVVFVIARYNEDISNFAEYNGNIVVYNKGENNIHPSIDRNCIINVPNLGREAGTYCNYILDNYDNLPDYMIFTQGNPCDHIAIFDPVTTFNKLREIYYEPKNYKFKYISSHKEPFDLESVAHIGLGVYVTPIELGNPKNINELIHDIRNYVRVKCIDQESRSEEIIDKLNNFGVPTIWPWEFNKMLMSSVWYCTSGEAQQMRHDITRDCFDYSKIKWLFDRPGGFSFGYGAIFIVHRDNIRKYSRAYWQRLFDSLQELLPGAGWGCERLWGFLLGSGDFY